MKKLFIFASLFIMSLFSYSQDTEKIHTTFIYNFTRMIEWPTEYKNGDFIIGVWSNSQTLLNHFHDLANTRSVGTQKIVIKPINSLSDITDKMHIIYIPNNNSRNIAQVNNRIKANELNTLIISNIENGARNGSNINFTIVDSRLRFEANLKSITAAGLNVSTEFSRLGIIVE